MKGLRTALEKVRLLTALGFVAGTVCVLVPGTSAAFSAASLTGGYGCLGHATTNDSSGTLLGISEVMRLGLDGAGHVKGKIVLNMNGEVCTIATTGTYNVNFGGLGTMNLAWNTATGDADGDTNCSTLLNALAITQHTDLVVVSGGGEFDFQSADDFLTAPTATDGGSLVDLKDPLVGSCKKQ
jgi:hypothetical protein